MYRCSDGDESSPNNITVASRNAKVSGQGYIRVTSRNRTLINLDHITFGFCKDSVPRARESDFTNCSFGFWLSEFQKPEKSLKETCEEFIMAVTMLIVDPMLSFVTKVTTVKVSLYSAGQNQRVDSVMGKPLMEQAFATPDKVVELVQKVKHRHSASVASGDGEDETLSAESFYTNNSFQTCKVSLKS
ncbi:hypothetical protein QYF36_007097 [Acer negundo]|nr:hypothetical protein QYF36_007097 [Acer negundo]